MKIAVCVKVTPHADARIKINAERTGIDAAGVKFVVGDYDEFAVEEAIRTKEKLGGEVVAFSVGTGIDSQIRGSCLALGADSAVIIQDEDAVSAGPLGVARALASAVQQAGCEIVFTGKSSIDHGHSQVSAMIAEILGWAQVSQATEFDTDGTTFTATRNMDAGLRQVVTGTLPVVVTCEDGLNTPRYAKLPDIMKAKRKPMSKVGLGEIGQSADAVAPTATVSGYAPPPPRPPGRIIDGDAATAAAELLRLLRDEAKVL